MQEEAARFGGSVGRATGDVRRSRFGPEIQSGKGACSECGDAFCCAARASSFVLPSQATYYDLLFQTRIAQQTKEKSDKAALVAVQLYALLKVIKGATHPNTLLARQNALKPPTFPELLAQQQNPY